jgi:uncharacterized protein
MPQLLFGVLGLVVLAVGAWAMIEHVPLGGQPNAAAPINVSAIAGGKNAEQPNLAARPEASTHIQPENAAAEPVRSIGSPPKTITIIDGSTGKRQEIVIPEAAEKNAELGEPAEIPRVTRNTGRPLPRPRSP